MSTFTLIYIEGLKTIFRSAGLENVGEYAYLCKRCTYNLKLSDSKSEAKQTAQKRTHFLDFRNLCLKYGHSFG